MNPCAVFFYFKWLLLWDSVSFLDMPNVTFCKRWKRLSCRQPHESWQVSHLKTSELHYFYLNPRYNLVTRIEKSVCQTSISQVDFWLLLQNKFIHLVELNCILRLKNVLDKLFFYIRNKMPHRELHSRLKEMHGKDTNH